MFPLAEQDLVKYSNSVMLMAETSKNFLLKEKRNLQIDTVLYKMSLQMIQPTERLQALWERPQIKFNKLAAVEVYTRVHT